MGEIEHIKTFLYGPSGLYINKYVPGVPPEYIMANHLEGFSPAVIEASWIGYLRGMRGESTLSLSMELLK